MRTAHKVDANQAEIIALLRKIPGCTVQILSMVGHGCPDYLVGFMGVNKLIEQKDHDKPPSKKRLTPDEARWHRQWGGQVDVCETFEDVCRVIGVGTEAAPF